MEESTSREKVLKSIREALISKTDPPFPKADHDKPLYQAMEDTEDIHFAQELTAAGGMFIYCSDEGELIENIHLLMKEKDIPELFVGEPTIKELMEAGRIPYVTGEDHFAVAKAGATSCEYLLARTGSIMVSSAQGSGRRMMVFPESHIVIAFASQLVPDLKDALGGLKKKYPDGLPSMISVITGPSRTADIEKTLVMGAHGPRQLFVFLLEDRPGF